MASPCVFSENIPESPQRSFFYLSLITKFIGGRLRCQRENRREASGKGADDLAHFQGKAANSLEYLHLCM